MDTGCKSLMATVDVVLARVEVPADLLMWAEDLRAGQLRGLHRSPIVVSISFVSSRLLHETFQLRLGHFLCKRTISRSAPHSSIWRPNPPGRADRNCVILSTKRLFTL